MILKAGNLKRVIALTGITAMLGMSATLISAQEGSVLRAAPPNPDMATLVPVADGFTRPIYVTDARDGSGRLFVVEQGGNIWIVQDGETLSQPFLDVSGKISREAAAGTGYTERGLLGLAFHPDYATNGTFFISYTDTAGSSVVARYHVSDDPNIANADSEFSIMRVDQPFPNHNGGHLDFGPDGYLYISLGDGGSGGDPQGNGQNLNALLGKILRIDVNVAEGERYTVPEDNPFVERSDAQPEIWLYGVRNVWRFSFDSETGDLYAADVGQNQWEEVNFIPAGEGGLNLGWNIYEGSHPYSGAPAPSDMVLPIGEYPHSQGISVTGGYVYRGAAIPDWQGVYLYGDFGSGIIWGAYRASTDQWVNVQLQDTNYTISSFGEDESGGLYLVDYNGTILEFVPPA